MDSASSPSERKRAVRIPQYSQLHPMVPRLYVPEWKTDMKNRKLIIQNAEQGGIPHYEHDENLFLEKREQLSYNVEDRTRVRSRYTLPARREMLAPPFAHHTSRYWSSLMHYKDNNEKQFEYEENDLDLC